MALFERVGRLAECNATWAPLGARIRASFGRELEFRTHPAAGGRAAARIALGAAQRRGGRSRRAIAVVVAPAAAGRLRQARTACFHRQWRPLPAGRRPIVGETWAPSRCLWPRSSARAAAGVGVLVYDMGRHAAWLSGRQGAAGGRSAGSAAVSARGGAAARPRAAGSMRAAGYDTGPVTARCTCAMGLKAAIHG